MWRPLDPARPEPLYLQLVSRLREALDTGELAPGAALAPEVMLAETLGVSRATVRQAIGELVQEGRLVRFRGRGTFVVQPKVAEDAVRLQGFTELMRARGLEPETRLLAYELRLAGDVAPHLGIDASDEVVRLTRLRGVAGTPLMVEASHLVAARFPDLHRFDLTGSLYRLLQDAYGVRVAAAEETVEAVLAAAHMARWLKIDPGQPLLLVRRTTRDGAGGVVEYVERYAAGSRTLIHLKLESDPPHIEWKARATAEGSSDGEV